MICECLEPRRLFTTYTYNVPSGHTAAYLEQIGTQGYVDVYLDSPTGTAAHHFTDPSGTDVVDCGPTTNFLFFDQVPAYYKPTGGTLVQGGSGGTLEIDAGIDDTYIQLTSSTSTSATVTTHDATDSVTANSSFGSGVNHLTIRTNDYVASNYYPYGGGTLVAVAGEAGSSGSCGDIPAHRHRPGNLRHDSSRSIPSGCVEFNR